MNDKKKKEGGLFQGLMAAHVIVLAHIVLLAVAGVTIVLFKGVYAYLPWVMGGIGILILASIWFFYRQIRNSSSDLHKILSMPEFQDRSVEIKLIGGLASFKMNEPKTDTIPVDRQLAGGHQPRMLLEQETRKIEDRLHTLTGLYEKNLITKEEYQRAKEKLIQG